MTETDAEVLHRLMRARFSCRGFLPDPLDEATIRGILDTARLTASWNNVQPWEVIVTGPGTTARLAAALVEAARAGAEAGSDLPYPREYRGVYAERRRACGYGLYEALSIRREDREAREGHRLNNFSFFGAPHVALVTMPEEFGPYGALDIGGFVTAFMLAARARGVDTLAQAALAQHAAVIRRMFDIPPERLFVCGIAFGRADPDHPANRFRTARVEPDAFARFV